MLNLLTAFSGSTPQVAYPSTHTTTSIQQYGFARPHTRLAFARAATAQRYIIAVARIVWECERASGAGGCFRAWRAGVLVCVCTYVRVCVCTCVFANTYIHTYIHTATISNLSRSAQSAALLYSYQGGERVARSLPACVVSLDYVHRYIDRLPTYLLYAERHAEMDQKEPGTADPPPEPAVDLRVGDRWCAAHK